KILLQVSWDEVLESLTADDRAKRNELRTKIRALEIEMPALPEEAWAVAEEKDAPPTHILKRGNLQQKKELVEPTFPHIFLGAVSDQARPSSNDRSSTSETAPRLDRLAMARWLTQPE